MPQGRSDRDADAYLWNMSGGRRGRDAPCAAKTCRRVLARNDYCGVPRGRRAALRHDHGGARWRRCSALGHDDARLYDGLFLIRNASTDQGQQRQQQENLLHSNLLDECGLDGFSKAHAGCMKTGQSAQALSSFATARPTLSRLALKKLRRRRCKTRDHQIARIERLLEFC